MRAGFALSAFIHVAALLWAFISIASPDLFEPAQADAIAVEIVPASAIDAPDEKPPKPDAKPLVVPSTQASAKTTDAPSSAAEEAKPAPQQPGPAAQEAKAEPEPPQPNADTPIAGARAADTPAAKMPPADTSASAMAAAGPSLAFFQQMMQIPPQTANAPNNASGFEQPAATKLSRDEIAAFKAHLQKCWSAPAGSTTAQDVKVVLRLSLQSNGTLAAQPILLSAPASAQGPPLVASATRALNQCQPYSFLPAAKYKEWKSLDIGFSPQGLIGG